MCEIFSVSVTLCPLVYVVVLPCPSTSILLQGMIFVSPIFFWGGGYHHPRPSPASFPLPSLHFSLSFHVLAVAVVGTCRVCACVCVRVFSCGVACCWQGICGVDDDVYHQPLASTSPSVRPRRDKRISNFLPRSWFEPCSGWPVLVLKGFVPEF